MKEMNFLTIVKTFLLTLVNGCCVYGVLHTCPTDTWVFGNSCVQVHFNELDWDDARAQCRRLGGDLLEVRSSEMQLFVQKHLIATGRRPAGYWIGATDRYHEDKWQWVHGDKTMHFSNWDKGQGPGQTGFFFSDGSLEDCAMIRPDAGYKWHDGPCAGGFAFHYPFLCEFEIVRISNATTKSTASILMSTLKPTQSSNNQTTNVFTQPSFPTDSPIPTTSITTTASPATVVTPTPTTSSSPLPTVTSVPSSPVTSTGVPISTTTTTASGVIHSPESPEEHYVWHFINLKPCSSDCADTECEDGLHDRLCPNLIREDNDLMTCLF